MSSYSPDKVVHAERLHGAESWSFVLRRGYTLRLTDIEGGANVALLAYNAAQPLERYNMPDTLKCQHTFLLTAGHCLYSDMGHILLSIAEDSVGWHDTVCGIADRAETEAKYGVGDYQTLRNGFHISGRERFLIELGKHGLGKRDMAANVNFFSKVSADGEGRLSYVAGHSKAGDHVDLRAEMDVLVVLNTCQHPLDPARAWAPKPVQLEVWASGTMTPDDICYRSRPENARGYENTRRCFCQHEHA
ncbi:urea amidolyase associated protein UAAP1 [Plasticicumulans acidivorans]|uniref:DUF1989 domain-containing protein n=1 Tax=Plasticicumulans acidivorans TaxID=886464 RepID=A0A317MZS9_9GAMM|nr:urea amidolyase associated protein UAAP1 [Plasticicumulans acidivorans]PWV65686.1 hypothetical protein C7443_101170 [Plasticicumulans acidivorans]